MNRQFRPRNAGVKKLDKISRLFDLSDVELARLFRLSPRTISLWQRQGVSPRRIADVDRIADLADYLAREFIADRLPKIVRTPGNDKNDSLRGRAILDVIRREGVSPVYRHLERLFAYGGV